MAKKTLHLPKPIVVDVEKIKPYERNVKRHLEDQVTKIAKSMGKFGMVQSIVVDKNFNIIIGHGRFEALKKDGYEAVEVYQLEIDGKEAAELRISDNKLSDSPYDISNLVAELQFIGVGDNLQDLGFSKMELDGMGLTLQDVKIETQRPVQTAAQQDVAGDLPLDFMEGHEAPTMSPITQENGGGVQNQKKPLTFFCTPEQYEFLYPVFQTSRKWEANVDLLMQLVTNSQN